MDFKDKIVVVTGGAQGIGRCIAALTHALAVSLAGRVRVNSISPGWIDTAYTVYEGPDAIQRGRQDVWAIHWILPIWRSTSAPTRLVSSLARTSASMAA